MSESVQLTEEELNSIKTLREQILEVITSVGQLKITQDLIEEDLNIAKTKLTEQTEKYKTLLVTEKDIIDSLTSKYGIGSLNIETGVFTPEK